MTICRTCGDDFDDKRPEFGGYIDQCNHCSRVSKDMARVYVGRQGLTNKDASIEVFRTNLNAVRKQLRRESTSGMRPNIGISNPGFAANEGKFGEE